MSKGKGFSMTDVAKLQAKGLKITGLEPRISQGKVFVSEPKESVPSDSSLLVFDNMKLFPSLNVALRKHWAKRKADGKILDFQVLAQNPIKYDCKVTITGVRYTCYPLDQDAIASTFKGALDSLVKMGIIVDDKPQWMQFSATQEKVSKRSLQRVEIKIEKFVGEDSFI